MRQPLRIAVFLIITALLSLLMVESAVSAVRLQGTVIAVKGFEATIQVELVEPYSPVVGNKVEFLEILDKGQVERSIGGDWQVTEVSGRLVKAEAINALGVNLPKVNMKAVIHLFEGPVHAGVAPQREEEKKPAPSARGKVIMTRGDMITIRLDEKKRPAAKGDIAELSYSVGGEVISVGTWRVSAVKEDGMVEAEPVEIKGKPNIGMDALLILQEQPEIPSRKEKQPEGIKAERADDEKSRYETACFSGNADACTNLGFLYGTGKGVALDYRRAVELYQQACDGGSITGCTNLGVMYRDGLGVAQDYSQSIAFFQKGCRDNHALGCLNLAHMYLKGESLNQDYSQAAKLFEKACISGSAQGCTHLGFMYENGSGVTQDFRRAVDYYKKGCDSGEATGCANLGYFYEIGEHVHRDFKLAKELYEKSCNGGHARGCGNLGWMCYTGRGTAADQVRGRVLMEQACKSGHSWSCSKLKELGNKN